MIWLRQSTAVVVSFGPAVLNSDGVTLVTNLVGTGANQTENTSTGIRLSKNGGAFAARHATATASTYDAFGNYLVTLDTTDTGTLGALRMQYANASAFCPLFMDMMVVPAAVWDTYFASSGGVAFPTSGTLANTTNITAGVITTVTTVTNQLTAAAIATGVWQDTTAGDFTTALSVGKSVMNGVSLGTGLTVAAVSGAVGSVTGAVGSVTGNVGGNVTGTVGSVVGAVGSVTGNVGGNVVGSVASVTARVTANTDQVNGDATAAADLAKAADTIIRGTCSGGTTTTAVVSTLVNPSSLTDSGQLIGRTIIFNGATATANVQGQASNITGSTTGATPTITFTAMTTAPANGDTFVIV